MNPFMYCHAKNYPSPHPPHLTWEDLITVYDNSSLKKAFWRLKTHLVWQIYNGQPATPHLHLVGGLTEKCPNWKNVLKDMVDNPQKFLPSLSKEKGEVRS